jgi:transposase InsO family protein
VNEKRVARVMWAFSITGIRLRRRVRTTVPDPAAALVPDLFQRDFTDTGPGCKYMGDITYFPLVGREFLHLATVLDCFSRWVLGWSIAGRIRTSPVSDALRMATQPRSGLDGAVFHSDHGRSTVPGPSPTSATSSGSPGRWMRSARVRTIRPAKASTCP